MCIEIKGKKCKNDNRLKICFLLILTILIMFIIGCYTNNKIVYIEYNLEFVDWNINSEINTNNFQKINNLLLLHVYVLIELQKRNVQYNEEKCIEITNNNKIILSLNDRNVYDLRYNYYNLGMVIRKYSNNIFKDNNIVVIVSHMNKQPQFIELLIIFQIQI